MEYGGQMALVANYQLFRNSNAQELRFVVDDAQKINFQNFPQV